MRPIPIGPSLLLGLMLTGTAWSAPQEPTSRPAERPAEADLDARFAALEAELEEAMQAFYDAIDQLPEDAGYADYPPYPGQVLYPHFRELADAEHLDAMFWCLDNVQFQAERTYVQELQAILDVAPGDTRIGDLMAWMHWSVPSPSAELMALLDGYLEAAPRDELRHATMGAKGMLLTMDETDKQALAEGLALLDGLLEVEDDFPGKSGIEGHVFKLRNLGVGMVAPDWSATDVDGAPIALSDYRGKVTVLEFWGFW